MHWFLSNEREGKSDISDFEMFTALRISSRGPEKFDIHILLMILRSGSDPDVARETEGASDVILF